MPHLHLVAIAHIGAANATQPGDSKQAPARGMLANVLKLARPAALSLTVWTLLLAQSSGRSAAADLEGPLRTQYHDDGRISERSLFVEAVGEPVSFLQAGPAGSKRLVVLIHGAVFSANTWKWVGTIDTLAARGFRVVALELHQYSGALSSERVRSHLLRDFLKALGWTAGPRSVLVVAASAGGTIAIPYILDPVGSQTVAGYCSISALVPPSASDASPSKLPALLVWGELDHPGSAKALATKHLFPSHQFVILPDAPHPAYLKEPKWFNELVARFASGHPADLPGHAQTLTAVASWREAADEL